MTAETCFFCTVIADPIKYSHAIVKVELGPFVAIWDANPTVAGHTLVVPKRHVQFMNDLDDVERSRLIDSVLAVKNYLKSADLLPIYQRLIRADVPSTAMPFLQSALQQLHTGHSAAEEAAPQPIDFNDGINDGPFAGQTVPHFHWHVMPRRKSDMPDPRGGIRHMFPGKGNYHDGLK